MLSILADQRKRRVEAATKQVRFHVQPCMTSQALVLTTMGVLSSGQLGHRWIGRDLDVTMMEHDQIGVL